MKVDADGWQADGSKWIGRQGGEYVLLIVRQSKVDGRWSAQAHRIGSDFSQKEFSGHLPGGVSLTEAKAVAEQAGERLLD
ncbi:hypothetical protein [Rhodococcus qingshengii]|uniref:hypothetical protein n=1 Tax=Rhodococcus qingshengii TaxID=334542 RepID=UPI0030162F54